MALVATVGLVSLLLGGGSLGNQGTGTLAVPPLAAAVGTTSSQAGSDSGLTTFANQPAILNMPAHAGYSLFAQTGSFSTAAGNWTEPSADCADHNALALIWVGLDDNGYHLEQAGSFVDCRGGSLAQSFWFEMWPHDPVSIPLPIKSGDRVGAEVRYASGHFILTVHNYSDGASWSTSQPGKYARIRAQWLVEAPLPFDLAPLGSVTFSGISVTDSVGHHGGINAGTWAISRLNMVRGHKPALAVTGATVKSGQAFRVTVP
jgi:hypothetical protein